MLKISSYTGTSNNAKDKRIGVPFAPSQSVNISTNVSSPFVSASASADAAKDATGNVSIYFPIVFDVSGI